MSASLSLMIFFSSRISTFDSVRGNPFGSLSSASARALYALSAIAVLSERRESNPRLQLGKRLRSFDPAWRRFVFSEHNSTPGREIRQAFLCFFGRFLSYACARFAQDFAQGGGLHDSVY